MALRAFRTAQVVALSIAWLVSGPIASGAADLRDVLTEYTVTSWAQKDGLPPGAIWSTAQDEDGYLWIATDAGLFRFDGVRFIQWSPPGSTSLPHLPVRVVHVSRDGSIWAGYGESGGISRILRGTVRTYGEQDGLPSGAVSAIVEDSRGSLWAGSSQGFFSWTGERWEKLQGHGLPDAAVFGAYLNTRDDLTIGTAAGLFRRAAGSDQFTQVEAQYRRHSAFSQRGHAGPAVRRRWHPRCERGGCV